MTDIFDAGSDDDAIAGEHVGYVPCTDEAFAGDVDDDSEAIDGSDAGYVADGTEAGDFADSDDSQTVYGSAVGFVAKPCCGITDTWGRPAQPAWGTSDSTLVWAIGYNPTVGTYTDGARGHLDAGTYPLDPQTARLPIDAYVPGETMECYFEFEPESIAVYPYGHEAFDQTHSRRFRVMTVLGAVEAFTTDFGFIISFSRQNSSDVLTTSSGLDIRRRNSGTAEVSENSDPFTWASGVYKVRCFSDYTNAYLRIWQGDPEPSSWTLTLDPNVGGPPVTAPTPPGPSDNTPSFKFEFVNFYTGSNPLVRVPQPDGLWIDNLSVWVDSVLICNR